MSIRNITGQYISWQSIHVTSTLESAAINTNGLTPGIYFAEIMAAGKLYVEKIVIE